MDIMSRRDVSMKNFTFASLLFAAALAAACQTVSVEEEPSFKEEEPQRISIPYSVNAAASETRIAYGENGFSIKEGDKILVTGKTRTDIEGYLALTDPSSFTFSGNLTYLSNQEAPDASTELVATLVHAGNGNVSSYANAVIGFTDDVPMQEAAENYTLFQAEYTYGDESALALEQKASFLEMTVTVDFQDAVGFNEALIPAGQTARINIDDNGTSFEGATTLSAASGSAVVAKCLAVVPAGKPLSSFHISVIDREVAFGAISERTLEANKKYTVSRSISFQPQLGDPYWSDGTYGRFSHPDASLVGLVVYVNDGSDLGKAITEEGNGGGHALVMALRNANTKATVGEQWGNKTLYSSPITTRAETLSTTPISGYSNTLTQNDANCNAAKLAKGYDAAMQEGTTSTGWFLPSVGQWMYAVCAYVDADPVNQWIDGNSNNWQNKIITNENDTFRSLIHIRKQTSATENLIVSMLNGRMDLLAENYGITCHSFGMYDGTDFADNYWTSSEQNAENGFRMNLGSVEEKKGFYYTTIKVQPLKKSEVSAWKKSFIMKVRPFLAF